MTFNNKVSQHPQLSCMLGAMIPTFMLMQNSLVNAIFIKQNNLDIRPVLVPPSMSKLT